MSFTCSVHQSGIKTNLNFLGVPLLQMHLVKLPSTCVGVEAGEGITNPAW